MTKEQNIQEAIDYFDKLTEFDNKIVDIFGDSGESNYLDTIWHLFDDYLDGISAKIGDKNQWLSWFLFENQKGKRKFGVEIDGNKITVKNVADLLKVLEK